MLTIAYVQLIKHLFTSGVVACSYKCTCTKCNILLVVVGTIWSSKPKPSQQPHPTKQFFLKTKLKTVLLGTVLPRLVIVKRSFTCLMYIEVLGHRKVKNIWCRARVSLLINDFVQLEVDLPLNSRHQHK